MCCSRILAPKESSAPWGGHPTLSKAHSFNTKNADHSPVRTPSVSLSVIIDASRAISEVPIYANRTMEEMDTWGPFQRAGQSTHRWRIHQRNIQPETDRCIVDGSSAWT